MPSLASTTTTRNPDFVVSITTPPISECLTPYMLGVLDAEKGMLCVPEMYFIWKGQMCEYAEGHEAVAGETLLSCQILSKPLPLSDEEIEAEAEDLEEDLLDREFWASGNW